MHEAMRSDEPNSSERTSSELPTGSSDSDQRPSVADLLDVTRNINQNWSLHHHDLAMNATQAAVAARNEPQDQNHAEPKKSKEGGEDNSDSSSMVVLARTKRKHQDGARDGAPNNESSISNTSNSEGSATSSEKRVHIQHPQHLEVVGAANADASDDDRIAVDDDAGDDSNDRDENLEESHRDSDRPDGQPEGSSSSSSSGDRNNGEAPGGAVQYGVPAVVSEYSSSNRNSSGENNGNPLSTSGSGSGGNTGSGTGSGSNQGGSSGSGNDQGIGTGSSGSGNDAKGSSEEMMDISGENNSGENSVENSDSSNKETAIINSKDAPAGSPGNAPHRHPSDSIHHSHYHQHLSGANSPPTHPMDQGDENAVRERKIQDKKRKRMNMRREYEEKVEQEMEYSETSCEKEVVIRPGKPVTLDKVLSFTKIPRLVVKAGPPFLVVYTNASYCRLSGIDSHIAVGKPVTNLLSLPDLNELSQLDVENVPGVTEMSTKEAQGDRKAEINSSPAAQGSQDHLDRTQDHSAAAAAGRARAAASSREDNQEIGLEPLIAASGFGRLQIINVRAKPHHMVGRNIKVIKTAIGQRRNHEEGSNAGSSITSSYDGPQHFVPCTMSISPVVSLPDAYNEIVVTDKEKSDTSYHHKHKRFEKDNESNPIIKSKRRKQHHHHQHGEDFFQHHSVRTNHPMKEVSKHHHLITHYVIQLEPFDGDFRNFGTLESQSSASTSVEAQMMGMTQAEVRRNRMRKAVKMETSNDMDKALADTADGGGDDDDEEIPSEDVSETQQHVSAVG
ncbi:hypothetical protein IV203_018257 [Nitzschia inconspicua]|uniref:PAS domain-containing protein n=1 Tax=Nitzschia inconspicua TaxID=303405 RepID=A0A9K3M1P6_9STRA|nr:hypothetical protein IV203_018257 [Nitzschia inconspicua]